MFRSKGFTQWVWSHFYNSPLTVMKFVNNCRLPVGALLFILKSFVTHAAIDPVSCSQHKTYIDKLCENFESTLKEKISNGINKRSRTLGESSLVEEISQHAVFCQTKIKMFHGRQNLMDVRDADLSFLVLLLAVCSLRWAGLEKL